MTILPGPGVPPPNGPTRTDSVTTTNFGDQPTLIQPALEPQQETPLSTLSLRDLFNEMSIALTARPARTILTALGTVLGVAALVATLGLAKTAGNQIVTRFDELAATKVTVEPSRSLGRSPDSQTSAVPWDAGDRLERLNGVRSAGTMSDVNLNGELARSVPVIDPLGQTEFQVPVIAVSPGLFRSARTTLFTGRVFDAGHDERADPVAVLGPAAAKRLNVTRVDNNPAIFIGDETFAVIGILANTEREPGLLNAVIIPDGLARQRYGLEAPSEVLIDVEVGAAELIRVQSTTALSPDKPEALQATASAPPSRVRGDVQSDLNALFLILGAVSLLVGTIGIANVTLVSVLERTGEIGLRRALGATRRHIAVQFLSESVALGAFAGLLGTSLGILCVVMVSANEQWTPVLDPWLPFAAPVLGAVTGLLAGTYPAWKAASTEPIAALRGLR